MASLAILDIDLICERGEGDNEPGVVIIRPKDVATGVLSTTNRFGYCLGRGRLGDPARTTPIRVLLMTQEVSIVRLKRVL